MEQCCVREKSRGCSPDRLSFHKANFACSLQSVCCPDQRGNLQQIDDIASDKDYAERLRLQREKIEVLKHEFQKKQELLIERDQQIARLLRQNQSLTETKSSHEQLLVDHERLKYEMDRLKEQSKAMALDLQAREGLGLQDTVRSLKETLASIKNQLQIAYVTNGRLEKSIATLRLQLSDKDQNAAYQIKLLKIRIDSLGCQLSGLRTQNQQLKRKSQVEGEQGQLQLSKIKDLTQILARTQDERDSYKQLNEQLEKAIQCLREKVSQLEIALHRESATSAVQLERRDTLIRKKETQAKDLRLKIEELEMKVRLLTNQGQQSKDEILRQSKELKKLKVQLQHHKSASNSGQGQVSELKKQLAAKEEQLSRLRECKQYERQVRQDINALRLDTRLVKKDQIDRIDDLISQIGAKFVKKKL